MPQLFVMPTAYTSTARVSHWVLWSIRYSSRQRMTRANNNTLSISPVPAVACCQKLSCRPHTSAANSAGTQLLRRLRSECALCSRCRCSLVRSCGSSTTERASSASVNAPNSAARAFIAVGTTEAGSTRSGSVSRYKRGAPDCGRSFHPPTSDTAGRLAKLIHECSVARYSTTAPRATAQGRRVAVNDFSGLLCSAIDSVAATVETNPPILCKTGFGGMVLCAAGSRAGVEPQVCHALHVLGVGKHVERNDLLQTIDPIGTESVQIPCQRGGVARDINNLRRPDFA